MKASEFYEAVAARYDCARHERFYRRVADELLDGVDPAGVASVLEVGSGTGFTTAAIASRFPGADIATIEPSPAMAALGARRCPQARHVGASLTDLHDDPCADLVVSSVSAHWLTAEEWRQLLTCARGATLAVSLPVGPAHPLPDGNARLARLLLHLRPQPLWRRPLRTGTRVIRDLELRFPTVAVRRVTIREEYASAGELAVSLYERGVLLSLFGERADEALELLLAPVPPFDGPAAAPPAAGDAAGSRPLSFVWAFALIVAGA